MKKEQNFGFYSGNRTVKDDTVEWCLDSGASRHMTGDRTILKDFQPLNGREQVVIASGVGLPIIGKGYVNIGAKNGTTLMIEVVL